MDLIYVRNENGAYSGGYLQNYDAVFEVSTDLDYITNTFEVTMVLPIDASGLLWAENQISTILYVEGEEYGGIIEGSVIDVEANTIKYTGRTWRGQLEQWIIEPPAGEDYLVVSGNLAESLRLLPMGSWLTVDDTDYSGGTYQFARYVSTFDGSARLLRAAQDNLRLSICFISAGSGGQAHLKVTEARDLTETIEMSQDYNDRIQLQITKDDTTPRHLICLGAGELKDREVVHLYADADWNITTTPIPGAHPVKTYDYSSSADLEADGRKQFAELISNHEQINVTIDGLDIKLADIVAAKDILTGEYVKAEITSIIWRCQNYGEYQTEDFEYKTKILL